MKKTHLGLPELLFAAWLSALSPLGCATLPAESSITRQELPTLIPKNIVNIEFPVNSERKLIVGYSTHGDGVADKFFSYDMPNPKDINEQPLIGFFPDSFFPIKYLGSKRVFDGYSLSPDKNSFIGYTRDGDFVLGINENGKIKSFFFKMIGADKPDSSGNYQDYSVSEYSESGS